MKSSTITSAALQKNNRLAIVKEIENKIKLKGLMKYSLKKCNLTK
jgi:hypothetical protein